MVLSIWQLGLRAVLGCWQVASSPECADTSRYNEAMSGYSGEDALSGYERGGFASGRPLSATPETSPTKDKKGDGAGSAAPPSCRGADQA